LLDKLADSGHILARMAYEIIFAPEAVEDIRRLHANDRSSIIAAIETHLRQQPRKESKSRIKRLRGLRQPEYRLRVADFRVYHDVAEHAVHILSVISKHLTYDWLERYGIPL
jgi:mRNA interferase RelE/StbE